jgi:hypothetical protein
MESKIIKRLDGHILQAHRLLCETVEGGAFERSRGWARCLTGSTIATFNTLFLFRPEVLTDEVLSDAAAYFDDWGVSHTVAFDEHWMPDGVNELDARCYQPLPPQPGMFLKGELRRMGSCPDLVVERVGTVAAVSAHCTLVSHLFGLPITETVHLFPFRQLQYDAIRHYLGYLDGVPVAIATGIVAEGVVSVWNVSTRDDVRRRGVAT